MLVVDLEGTISRWGTPVLIRDRLGRIQFTNEAYDDLWRSLGVDGPFLRMRIGNFAETGVMISKELINTTRNCEKSVLSMGDTVYQPAHVIISVDGKTLIPARGRRFNAIKSRETGKVIGYWAEGFPYRPSTYTEFYQLYLDNVPKKRLAMRYFLESMGLNSYFRGDPTPSEIRAFVHILDARSIKREAKGLGIADSTLKRQRWSLTRKLTANLKQIVDQIHEEQSPL